MILATDVHYDGDRSATAAGVLFDDWSDAQPSGQHTVHIAPVTRYEPGAFYKRELPCIEALLNSLPAAPSLIVIDGFATLGAEGRPGLGAHLYQALDRRIPVIGVAKSPFRDTPKEAELLRGTSKTPLWISSCGLPLSTAKTYIAGMRGAYRIPTMLRLVDQLCRNAYPPKENAPT